MKGRHSPLPETQIESGAQLGGEGNWPPQQIAALLELHKGTISGHSHISTLSDIWVADEAACTKFWAYGL